MKTKLIFLALALTATDGFSQTPLGTAFTFQGQLQTNGGPVNVPYDLRFSLFDTAAVGTGNQISTSITNLGVVVSNGLFSVTLDFGSGAFTGSARWVEIGAAASPSGGVLPSMTPRQPLTPTPGAIFALTASNLSGSVSDSQLSSNIPRLNGPGVFTGSNYFGGATILTNPANGFAGNGAGLLNLNATNIGNGTANISILGNAATATTAGSATTASNFSGSVSDPQLSSNIPRLNGTNLFTLTNVFSGVAIVTNAANVFAGNGAGLTSLAGASIANASISNSAIANNTITANRIAPGQLVSSLNGVTDGITLVQGSNISISNNAFAKAITISSTGAGGSTGLALLGGTNLFTGTNIFGNTAILTNLANTLAGGTLNLPATTNANWGVINSGGSSLLHAYGNQNFFGGANAGNFTLTGNFNTGVGYGALQNNALGGANTANGYAALTSNTDGNANTASGAEALFYNTTGGNNTAHGAGALHSNTNGYDNTALGTDALRNNTSGAASTAVGSQALYNNTSGINNTAVGQQAMYNNTSGQDNTVHGYQALFANTNGAQNTALGNFALRLNTSGGNNSAIGFQALYNNTTGDYNIANGRDALFNNITGFHNTAIGPDALYNNTGNNNIALGFQAGASLTTGGLNIDIGNTGVAGESSAIRIGAQGNQTSTYIVGINGVTVSGGSPVYILPSGQLGTVTSSARFKDNIQSMDDASTVLLKLRPVSFHYKAELDPKAIAQFGLIAEEVDKVDPDLVLRDEKNQIYTVRYEAVNAMLLNEFLKEHRKVEEQGKEIEELRQKLGAVQNEVAARLDVLEKAAARAALSSKQTITSEREVARGK